MALALKLSTSPPAFVRINCCWMTVPGKIDAERLVGLTTATGGPWTRRLTGTVTTGLMGSLLAISTSAEWTPGVRPSVEICN